MNFWWFILLVILWTGFEGLREYHQWLIGWNAKFQPRSADLFVKRMNAVTFAVVIGCLVWFTIGVHPVAIGYLFTAASIRWIMLDGVLNECRDLDWWFVGERATTDRLIRWMADRWMTSDATMAMIVKTIALALSIAGIELL